MVQFNGILTDIKTYKDSSHWGIFFIQIKDAQKGELKKGDVVCAKGVIYTPVVGREYMVKGDIDHSKVWGDQIEIKEAIAINPITNENEKKFIIKKVYPKYWERMYETLEDPYDALLNKDYENLTKIYGCGFHRAASWINTFYESLHLHKAYVELARLTVSDNTVKNIVSYCHNDVNKAVDLIKNNPYDLININGIGWSTADDLALKSGIKPYSTERIASCIEIFLKNQGSNGKSYSTSEEVMHEIIDKIGEDVPDFNIAEAMHYLKNRDIIMWNEDKTKIGLKYFYTLEFEIADQLLRLKNGPNEFNYDNWEKVIKEKEKEQGWEYTEQQIEGIKMVLENQVSCISGYGGTGKTSIIDGILAVLEDYKSITVALAGRAAARVAETTGEKSMTIHRSLKLNSKKLKYDYETNPIPYDIVIVDEMSMINGYLYLQILKSIRTGGKIVFIGDVGQLESIGSCAVAADMLDSPYIASIFLDKIHRQAQKSAIITESIKVRQGKQLVSKDWIGEETRGELKDMVLRVYTDKSNTYHEIVKYFTEELSKGKSILDVQIIVPSKQGVASVKNLNKIAQKIYNPDNKGYKVKSGSDYWELRIGDKVINKLNKYNVPLDTGMMTDIFNGNLGIVKDIKEKYILIDFQGIGPVRVPLGHARNIELGYAITCHSAQGSQFPVVIGGIDFSMYIMLSKELLYTMITRASEKFILCAQNKALRYTVLQNQIISRQTYLLGILEEKCNKEKFKF